MTISVKKLKPTAKLPYRATKDSAGADLFACLDEPVTVKPMERKLIPTGIAASIPVNMGGFVFPRSGNAVKKGMSLANAVGVIDSDYRGEISVPVINLSDSPFTIEDGDRIAQLVIIPVELCEFKQEDELNVTDRNIGGFGSTGTK